jgi:hypothetical protein
LSEPADAQGVDHNTFVAVIVVAVLLAIVVMQGLSTVGGKQRRLAARDRRGRTLELLDQLERWRSKYPRN